MNFIRSARSRRISSNFKVSSHGQFLNFFTEWILLGWRGCQSQSYTHFNSVQVPLVRQVVDNVSECSTFLCFFAQDRSILLLAYASLLTPLVPEKQLDPAMLGVPFFNCRCAVSGGSQRSRKNQSCKVFVINVLITSVFGRFLSSCRTHKRFFIFIFIFMHVWRLSRVCCLSL